MTPSPPDFPLPFRPNVTEATLGWVYGADPPVSTAFTGASPAECLEDRLVEILALGRPVVAFSGGRDSSVVLATTVRVARTHGLEEPVAVTLRYPSLPETDERSWQESVISHLGLQDWHVVDLTDENGFTGEHAAANLAMGGSYFPYAAHTAAPIARAADGATVLTGEGGDLVLCPHRTWALANVIDRRGRVEVAAWRAAAAGTAPTAVRAARAGREAVSARPWLTREGAAMARRSASADAADEPLTWPAATLRVGRLRAIRAGLATLRSVYARAGASVAHPLLDPGFVAALAGTYGRLGPLSRSRVVSDLAGHLLPPEVTFRRTKSDFTRALVTPEVRRHVEDWDGSTGVDRSLVDPDRLRAEWLSPRPSALSLQLLLEVVAATRGAGARP